MEGSSMPLSYINSLNSPLSISSFSNAIMYELSRLEARKSSVLGSNYFRIEPNPSQAYFSLQLALHLTENRCSSLLRSPASLVSAWEPIEWPIRWMHHSRAKWYRSSFWAASAKLACWASIGSAGVNSIPCYPYFCSSTLWTRSLGRWRHWTSCVGPHNSTLFAWCSAHWGRTARGLRYPGFVIAQ
jgi:hypothetical protein